LLSSCFLFLKNFVGVVPFLAGTVCVLVLDRVCPLLVCCCFVLFLLLVLFYIFGYLWLSLDVYRYVFISVGVFVYLWMAWAVLAVAPVLLGWRVRVD